MLHLKKKQWMRSAKHHTRHPLEKQAKQHTHSPAVHDVNSAASAKNMNTFTKTIPKSLPMVFTTAQQDKKQVPPMLGSQPAAQ